VTAGRPSSADAVDAALAEGRAALVAYLPVGFPDLPTSIAAARALVEGRQDRQEATRLIQQVSNFYRSSPNYQRELAVLEAWRARHPLP